MPQQPQPGANAIVRRPGRLIQLAIFFVSLAWVGLANSLAASAARGIAVRLRWPDGYPLLVAAFLLFLLAIGFSVLDGTQSGTQSGTSPDLPQDNQQASQPDLQPYPATNNTLPTLRPRRRSLTEPGAVRELFGLPRRFTSGQEWLTGAALGWGVIVLAVLPMALAGKLHVRFWTEPEALTLALIQLASVLLLALASEVSFRGTPYRRLIGAVGPFWATLVLSLLYGWVVTGWAGSLSLNPLGSNAGSNAGSNGSSASGFATHGFAASGQLFTGQPVSHAATATAILLGLLLSWAWLRTHALWLGWGLHFAWIASLGILFGLPVLGLDNLSTVVETRAIGVEWLTGGVFGPEGAALTLLLLIAALVLLPRLTRDWAWQYTHPPIIAAGYPMDVPPPAAHTAMAAPPAPPALVQILPTTPQTRSVSEP